LDHASVEAAHQRVVTGDPLARSQLVELVLPPLIAFVHRAVPGFADPQDVEECCLDALFEYLQNPASYDPTRARLFTWLAGKARFGALTRKRNLRRQQAFEKIVTARIQDERLANDKEVEGEVIDVIAVGEIVEKHLKEIVKEDGDLDIFLLIAAGARDTCDYLDALSMSDTPIHRRTVIARRERVRGRLRRLRERL